MTRRILPILAFLAVALPTWVACGGDGTTNPEPELGDLDPLAVADSLDALIDPLVAVREVSGNFRMALEDLREDGVQFRRTARDRHPAAATFPPEFLGQTFRYGSIEGRWLPDEDRTGAPADGVRVLWYQLDGSGEIELPTHEKGHIDLTDGDDPSLEQIRIHGVEVRTSEENIDLLDFVQGYALGDPADVFRASGSYADALRDVDFTIDVEQSGGGAGGQQYEVVVTLEDGPIAYELRAQGTGSAPGGGFQDSFRATLELGADVTVLDLQLSGVGPESDASGTITHNGVLLAHVAADGTLYSFTNADGDPLSATSASELNVMVPKLLRAWSDPFTRLPLELP